MRSITKRVRLRITEDFMDEVREYVKQSCTEQELHALYGCDFGSYLMAAYTNLLQGRSGAAAYVREHRNELTTNPVHVVFEPVALQPPMMTITSDKAAGTVMVRNNRVWFCVDGQTVFRARVGELTRDIEILEEQNAATRFGNVCRRAWDAVRDYLRRPAVDIQG